MSVVHSVDGPKHSRDLSVVFTVRQNDIFDAVLPYVDRALRARGVAINIIAVPHGSTNAETLRKLNSSKYEITSAHVRFTDGSCRIAFEAISTTAEGSVAYNLDQLLASAVREITLDPGVRKPMLLAYQASESSTDPEQHQHFAELCLTTEAPLFADLLLPIVSAYPNHRFVIAAPLLMNHMPFMGHILGLRRSYELQNGPTDAEMRGERWLMEPDRILDRAELPESISNKLAPLCASGQLSPAQWLATILRRLQVSEGQIVIARTARELLATCGSEDRHLHVLLADRHLLEERRLMTFLAPVLTLPTLREYYARHIVAGPTFRLPLENLLVDVSSQNLLPQMPGLQATDMREALGRQLAKLVVKVLGLASPGTNDHAAAS